MSSPHPPAWRHTGDQPSLPESHASVRIPKNAGFFRKMLAFAGPGALVAVGYMDPGNWATDIQGGSTWGFTLLWVILLSNLMAVLLQALCARLGIATGRDLAQACRDHYSKPVSNFLWLVCEAAICACDLAEVIGSALALKLLFGLPMVWGVCLTSLDVFVMLLLQRRGFRWVEALVISLILLIGGCFLLQILWAKPDAGGILRGFAPSLDILKDKEMLFVAIGILGATVMPHNLYLHSSIVQTRDFDRTPEGKKEALKFATIDSTLSLMFALFINAAILIVAAAAFYGTKHQGIASIEDAHQLLAPVLGVGAAGAVFAIALLASGQNSTLTGTLAGQIVMEGFLRIRLQPWLRRLITRGIAIIPAALVAGIWGDSATTKLLVWSQVILSLQLPFAVIPLILFVGCKKKMGELSAPRWQLALAWMTAAIIVVLNLKLVADFFGLTDFVLGLFGKAA